MSNKMSYRRAARLVRDVGMDVDDGLALTFSCADYPDWIRGMNGWAVEDAAQEIAQRPASQRPTGGE